MLLNLSLSKYKNQLERKKFLLQISFCFTFEL
jgi:hypothetical protein